MVATQEFKCVFVGSLIFKDHFKPGFFTLPSRLDPKLHKFGQFVIVREHLMNFCERRCDFVGNLRPQSVLMHLVIDNAFAYIFRIACCQVTPIARNGHCFESLREL